MRKIFIGIAIAAVCWALMFSPWTAASLNFWASMIASTGILTIYAVLTEKKALKEIFAYRTSLILVGIISAALLYFLFFAGNYISKLLFDFAETQVAGIYSTKSQAGRIVIAIALVVWIGPAEELFWRGFVQHNFAKTSGGTKAVIYTVAFYTLVHIWSFNFMLIGAAFICGIFWSLMYYKYKSIVPGIISHAIWDVFAFIIIPFQ